MSKFLLEQLESKFEELEIKETLEEDELEEANVTGNMDGGAGPMKTPAAFAKSQDEDDLDTDHIEVFGYKKPKKTKLNTESQSMKKLEDKLERLIEATYRDFKNDDSMKSHQNSTTAALAGGPGPNPIKVQQLPRWLGASPPRLGLMPGWLEPRHEIDATNARMVEATTRD